MKMLLIAAALTFASYAHADQTQVQSQDQDMAAVCQAEMDGGQELSPTCEARLACLADGVQDASCQTYCAQYPSDVEACTSQATVDTDMARRYRRHHRSWYCRRHPFVLRCRFR